MENEKKEAFAFRQKVTNGSPITLKKELKRDARVKKITVEFPDGEDGDLQIEIWATTPEGSPKDLINIIGNEKYLSGNGSKAEYNIDVPLEKYSTIYTKGTNLEPLSITDDLYKYPILVDMEVEYNG